ncbi:MAG: sulfurtransferase [Planctomycetes bacterium]|nr:sulfurtransferase [Planctomycetota bacterium]
MSEAKAGESVSAQQLLDERSGARAPLLIDVRKQPAFRAATEWASGALRRDPATVATWGQELPRESRVVVYCARGHDVSQGAARELRQLGFDCVYVEGGIEQGLKPANAPLSVKSADAPTRWVTRARPKIDRIACPWLITRFIDADAEFLYVAPPEVLRTAEERRALPYDVPDVALSHVGERCTFDALQAAHHISDPALAKLATIVRGADTGRLDLAPQCAGLLALSLGLSRKFADDHAMLRHGMVAYDALYLWCREAADEAHGWNPAALREAARGGG